MGLRNWQGLHLGCNNDLSRSLYRTINGYVNANIFICYKEETEENLAFPISKLLRMGCQPNLVQSVAHYIDEVSQLQLSASTKGCRECH